MSDICFYFQVHQPDRLRQDYTVNEIGNSPFYLDEAGNKEIFLKVANKCYLPTVYLLKKLIEETEGDFKCTFSFSGTFLEQAERFGPHVLMAFRDLYETGQKYNKNSVEILSETYYHSLSFLYSKEEWQAQIIKHKNKIQELFGCTPTVFRNTELIYNNQIGSDIADMGYKAMLAEGVDRNLDWRSPNFLYHHPTQEEFKLFLKNYSLSDDIAFRFSNKGWNEFPLTAEKYLGWLQRANVNSNLINLFMDFETFGEHQWENTGIFEFMYHMIHQVNNTDNINFTTPSQALIDYNSLDEYQAVELTSWADEERDLSAWRSNQLQEHALEKIYSLEAGIKSTGDSDLYTIWQRLTTSDHFYYMCTKYFNDGDVHQYFSPFDTPYNAYITYMNVVSDLEQRVISHHAYVPSEVKQKSVSI